MRTPLLAAQEVPRWQGTDLTTDAAWEQCLHDQRQALRELLQRPEIRHALALASSSLDQAIERWLRDPDDRKGRKAERALARYVGRMATRCTPFGLFSGCSVGRVDLSRGDSQLRLLGRETYRSSSRLDFGFLCDLVSALQKDPRIAAELTYYPNTSLVRAGNGWHYIETRPTSEFSRHVVRLATDRFLEAVIETAADGAKFDRLVDAVRRQDASAAISEEDAQGYVLGLIANDVLTSSLWPPVTGVHVVGRLMDELEKHAGSEWAVDILRRATAILGDADALGIGRARTQYPRLAAALAPLPVSRPAEQAVQVDLMKPADAWLGRAVIDELESALDVLSRLGNLRDAREPRVLTEFRDSFMRRYDRAWVPLLAVMDDDLGIGFELPAEGDRVGGEEHTPANREHQSGFNGLDALLLQKLVQLGPAVGEDLVLTSEDIDAMGVPTGKPPHSIEVAATLVSHSSRVAAGEDFRVILRGISGPPAARLAARFCHLDSRLEADIRARIAAEEMEHCDAVYAEVAHLPDARLGNIVQRPVLRSYEVAFLGRSGAPAERVLPVSDLLVTVAEDGTILLFSQRLGRRIIPRITNAHGFANPKLAPLYRFLAFLQFQNVRELWFGWGALDTQPYLPRVRAGRTILSRARWRIDESELDAFRHGNQRALHQAAQRPRQRRHLPRYIDLMEIDHTVAVDLDDPLSVESFTRLLASARSATVEEQYPSRDQLCVEGPEGRFFHEIIVPFRRRAAEDKPPSHAVSLALLAAPDAVDPCSRTYPPGGEWLYLKIYAGKTGLDEMLSAVFAPMLRTLMSQGTLRKWFFIRYADPDNHVRLRLNGASGVLLNNVLPRMLSLCQTTNGLASSWKIQADTYQREVERYGGIQAMSAVEDIFWADSEAVLAILPLLEGRGDAVRWVATTYGVHRLLADWSDETRGVHAVVRWLRDCRLQGEPNPATIKNRLIDLFTERRSLLDHFFGAVRPEPWIARVHEAFDVRSERIREALARVKELKTNNVLRTTPEAFLANIAHMHVNRMLRSYSRFLEGAAYDALGLLYRGRLAHSSVEHVGGGPALVGEQTS